MTQTQITQLSPFEQLLKEQSRAIPKAGDLIEGTIVAVSKNEVLIDLEGYRIGTVRGPQLHDESGEYANVKVGDHVTATVLDLENELGQVELSFQHAGHKRAWDKLRELMKLGTIIPATIVSANKGGLLVRVGNTSGFLPVSQLSVDHYPRVDGGDKNRILEKLNRFTNQVFEVKVIDVQEQSEKLIVSERAAWDERQKKIIEGFAVGDTVEGTVTGVVDFGAFIGFNGGLEGLVHISELAWQRIDHPRDVIHVGETIKAKIISIDGSKISLSIKRLIDDPWKEAAERYTVGQLVTGKIIKINPFGLFVELDENIHGLAHISELANTPVTNPESIAHIGDTREFKIISIDALEHRLGLSIRALTEPASFAEGASATKAEPVESGEAPLDTVVSSDALASTPESAQEPTV
ncbi:S1 RNA-binding domain-containing protein [Candidatus Uhrbacteria bacterium]|nr:S1 RNA-binding domain-containing protein [Candidatus Uhrbacteria bacterium]